MRWLAGAALSVLTLGCGVRAGASAQSTPPPDLERLEAAVDSGRVEGARDGVERWLATTGASAPADHLARARLLRARLMQDADSARMEYLWVAIDGRSAHGGEAWFRLAQLDLALGDLERSLQDLEQLRSDYPRSPLVPASWLWTGRALERSGDFEAACDAWERAVEEGRRAEAPDLVERAQGASRECGRGGLRLTLQLGAFSEREGAEAVVGRAAEAGVRARVVREDGLYKVRAGRFGSAEAARETARRLEAAGFQVAVVADTP